MAPSTGMCRYEALMVIRAAKRTAKADWRIRWWSWRGWRSRLVSRVLSPTFKGNGLRHPMTDRKHWSLLCLLFLTPIKQIFVYRENGCTKRAMTQRNRLDRDPPQTSKQQRWAVWLFPICCIFHLQEQKHKGLTYWFMFHVLETKCIFWVGCFSGRLFHDIAFAGGVETTVATTKLPLPRG